MRSSKEGRQQPEEQAPAFKGKYFVIEPKHHKSGPSIKEEKHQAKSHTPARKGVVVMIRPNRSNPTITLVDVEKLAPGIAKPRAQLFSHMLSRTDEFSGKNPAAVLLGHLGGLKGGPARARKLSAARRHDIARAAAEARWQQK